jgi:hypothetical protein
VVTPTPASVEPATPPSTAPNAGSPITFHGTTDDGFSVRVSLSADRLWVLEYEFVRGPLDPSVEQDTCVVRASRTRLLQVVDGEFIDSQSIESAGVRVHGRLTAEGIEVELTIEKTCTTPMAWFATLQEAR